MLVIPPTSPYGDVGPFEAVVGPHQYLLCWDCGWQLLEGKTTTGATILACTQCKRVLDVRRLD